MELKGGFLLYKGFYEPIKHLSNEQLGRLFRAIFEYQINGCEEIDDDIKIAFLFLKNQFDLDKQKWEEVKLKRIEAGRKGGLSKAASQKSSKPSKAKQCLDESSKPSKAKQNQANQADNVNVNVNINNKSKDLQKSENFGEEEEDSVKEKKEFGDPTVNEIIKVLTDINDGLLDGTVKENRNYSKLLSDKIKKVSSFNGDFTVFINKIYNESDSFHRGFFSSPKKLYYNLAKILLSIVNCRDKNIENGPIGQFKNNSSNTYTVDNFTDRLNFTDINNEEMTIKEIKTNFNFPTYNEDYLKTMIRIIKHIGIDKAKEEYKEVSKTAFNGIAPLDWLEDHLYSKYINEVNNNN